MANSVLIEKNGPDWPLGNIAVPTPGTPVRITSLIDPTNANAPETVPSSSAPGTATGDEYTPRAQQIIFQAYKVGAQPPAFANNTGLIYILQKSGTGSNNKTDEGVIVAILSPGQTFVLSSAPVDRNVFSPYRYWIDADTAGDACQVTMLVAG